MSMHIAGYEINYEHSALEIFVSGCTRGCPGCHNPELQAYGVGKKWQRWIRDHAYHLTYEYSRLINKIWVMGGDLLCQPPEDAVEFLKALRKAAPELQIIVWTGASRFTDLDPDINAACDGFKMGAYDETKAGRYPAGYTEPDGSFTNVHLASKNQFFIFNGGTYAD